MSTPPHSPLPWRLFNSDDIIDLDGLLVADFGGCLNGDANAAHVVLAANNHHALREALKAFEDLTRFPAGDHVEIPDGEWRDVMQQARAALAQVAP